MEGQKYRPARESCVVKLEAVDEDFVLAHRGMRAIPLSSDSFREVASGLSAANEAMNQLSRIGRRSTTPPRGHDPTFDSLAFDDWMETIVSIFMASKKFRYCNLFSRQSLYKAMNLSENEAKRADKHANKRIIYWPPFWNKVYMTAFTKLNSV